MRNYEKYIDFLTLLSPHNSFHNFFNIHPYNHNPFSFTYVNIYIYKEKTLNADYLRRNQPE